MSTNYEKNFSAEQFSVSASATANLQQQNTPDFTDSGLSSYTVVKYSTTNTVLSRLTWQNGYTTSFQFSATGPIKGNVQVNVEVFSTYSTYDTQNTCVTNQGYYNGVSCLYYYVLEGVCIKVSSNNGTLQLDTHYGGPGCFYSNGFPEDVGRWIPALYTKVPYNNGAVLSQTFDFSGMNVGVRHNNDPFIFAENLTQGSLSFGLTPGQKMGVGLVLMAIGGFFFLPCCIFIVVLAICCQRKRHHHGYEALHY